MILANGEGSRINLIEISYASTRPYDDLIDCNVYPAPKGSTVLCLQFRGNLQSTEFWYTPEANNDDPELAKATAESDLRKINAFFDRLEARAASVKVIIEDPMEKEGKQ